MRRRDFLKIAAVTPLILSGAIPAASQMPQGTFHEALYYRKSGRNVECLLCPRGCILSDGDTGFCRARKAISGRLFSLGYGTPCAVHIDPIEKKPFSHVLPKTLSFSIASAGCNFRCRFCQNWQISQVSPLETMNMTLSPADVVATAIRKDCRSIAYTYSEPTNFYEYMFDTAKIARKKGVLNVSHSNGYINPEPLKALCTCMDAVNIDLKGFSSDFYNKLCEGTLEPVLATIKALKRSGVWVEITNLVIDGHNDDESMITRMCAWLRKEVGADVPVHFSRFHPMHKMTMVPPTPVRSLERAREIALAQGLQFAYVGNVPGHPGENTYCPRCKKLIIQRSGYNVLATAMKGPRCSHCGAKIGGIWRT